MVSSVYAKNSLERKIFKKHLKSGGILKGIKLN